MRNLPKRVTAAGLTIPAGQSRGIMLVTAAVDATRDMSSATMMGKALIGEGVVERPCKLASMAWPVPDAWQEIPNPRLLADVPVSVIDNELATMTLQSQSSQPLEVLRGEKLVISLTIQRRSEFSGASMPMRIFGDGFSQAGTIDVSLTEDTNDISLDLASLKTPPGDYTIAFYGNAVAKYVSTLQQPSQATDIVDIIVSEPIAIRVLPGEAP
jgi:hypothetical protein